MLSYPILSFVLSCPVLSLVLLSFQVWSFNLKPTSYDFSIERSMPLSSFRLFDVEFHKRKRKRKSNDSYTNPSHFLCFFPSFAGWLSPRFHPCFFSGTYRIFYRITLPRTTSLLLLFFFRKKQAERGEPLIVYYSIV